jgi:hypothetical protein
MVERDVEERNDEIKEICFKGEVGKKMNNRRKGKKKKKKKKKKEKGAGSSAWLASFPVTNYFPQLLTCIGKAVMGL